MTENHSHRQRTSQVPFRPNDQKTPHHDGSSSLTTLPKTPDQPPKRTCCQKTTVKVSPDTTLDRPEKTRAKTKINEYFKPSNSRHNPLPSQVPNQDPHAAVLHTSADNHQPRSGKPHNNFKTIVKQINLQKKKTANRTYFQELKNNEILLGQEPYFCKNKLMAVPTTHKSFTPFHKDTPRVCIILPIELGRISYTMTHFCNRDMVSVRCNLKNRSDTIFCSLYMGHEPNKPEIEPDTVKKMANLVEFTKKKNLPLVMGADSNGHHQLWNSFKKNDRRGIILAEMIANLDLSVSNEGKSATFLNSRGQKSIIDITLTNKKGSKLVKDWQVSQETSLSDHKMITFSIDLGNKWESYNRNFKEMDENNFARVVKRKMTEKPFRAKIGKFKRSNIDSSVTYLNKVLTEALDEVCPMVKVVHKSKIPWSKDLTILKRKAKKAKGKRIARKAKSAKSRPATQTPSSDSEDESEKIYKKAIATKDKQAYRDFCSNLHKPKDIAKTTKQKRKPWEDLNVLQKTDGSYTEDSVETLTVLAEEHFKKTDDSFTTTHASNEVHDSTEDITTIDNILNPSRLERVIKKLPLNKAPGLDGIRNNMIKAAWASICQPLSHIYKQCLTYSYCPRTWKTSKGIIIPKEGKDDYTSPRSFRII